MSILKAARVDDPIAHSSLAGMLLKAGSSLVTNVVAGLAGGVLLTAAIKGAVFLACLGPIGWIAGAVLIAGALAANYVIDEAAEAVDEKAHSWIDDKFPPVVEGKIAGGSPNVFVNSRNLARALPDALPGDGVKCDRHSPPECVAQGSENVLVNNWPAHRKTECSTCDAKTHEGSPNVLIGGPTKTLRTIKPEIPAWLKYINYAVALVKTIKDVRKLKLTSICDLIATFAGGGVPGASGRRPIHAAMGHKYLRGEDDLDFSLAAILPVAWQRCYSSRDLRTETLFGPGWSTPFEIELQLAAYDDTCTDAAAQPQHCLVNEDGLKLDFGHLQPGHSLLIVNHGWTLIRMPDGGWAARHPDGLFYDFARLPQVRQGRPCVLRPRSIQDRNRNAIALGYEEFPNGETGRLLHVADSAKRIYDLHYCAEHGRRVESIRCQQLIDSAELVRYRYDERGRLVEVINRLGQTTRRFSWHDQGPGTGLMASHTVSTGLQSSYEWALFAPEQHPRVVRHSTNTGESLRLEYRLPGDDGQGHTQATDQSGHRQHWTWQAQSYLLLGHVDAMDRRWQLQWNEQGLLEKVRQPNGGIWTIEYDSQGNPIAQTDPLGAQTRLAWDAALELPVEEIDALGRRTTSEYDAQGNLIRLSHPGGEQTCTVDEQGLVTRIVDERGGTSHWVWNGLGLLVQHTDCSGRRTRFEHDSEGRLLTRTDADGQTTRSEYDALHRIVRLITPDGQWQRWQYNAAGLLARAISPAAGPSDATDLEALEPGQAPQPVRITRTDWTASGQLSTLTDAAGGTIRLHYNRAGDLETLEDGLGQATRFLRNAAGELVGEIGVDDLTKRYELDAMGLPVRIVQKDEAVHADGLASTTMLERDLLGRLISKTTADTRTQYRYDALGRIIAITRHAQARHGWSAAQAAEGGQPLLDELQLTWSPAGDLVGEQQTIHALLMPAVAHAGTRLDNDRPSPTLHPAFAHVQVLEPPRIRALRHQHDALGHTTATELPGGQSIQWLHYGSGHLHQINLDGVVVTDLQRDALHQETHRSQGLLNQVLQRDSMGRITHKKVLNGQLPRTIANAMAGGASRASHHGFTKAWQYDRAGMVSARHDRVQGEQHYQYDPLGRLIASSNQPPDHPQPEGRRIPAQARAALTQAYHWDAASNALPAAHAGPAGSAGQAANDAAMRLPANPLAPPAPAGAPPAQAQNLRVLHTRLTPGNSNGLVQKNRVMVWQDIRYHYDSLGRVTRKVSGKRQDLRIFWNAENQITCTISERKGQASITRYHYDVLGRRIAVQTRSSAQYPMPHPAQGLQGHLRQQSVATSWFTWSGMRLLQQEWPQNAPRPEKSWEPRHSATALTHTYLYTDEDSYEALARIEHRLDEQAITAQAIAYFHTDLNGAPEELTAATGEIQWQLRYSHWGSAVMEQWWPQQPDNDTPAASHPQRTSALYPRAEQPFEGLHPHQQNLRYQGQYLDRDTGLHYNTFRYYDADTGRFLCQDPIGLAGGMNLYQYAPNALDWIDPWGWQKCKIAGFENLKKAGLEKLNLARESFNSGRKKLEALGFRIIERTKTGRVRFLHPKSGTEVKFDGSGKALVPGQKPHWEIQTQGGARLDRSGRVVQGESPIMGGKHIPARRK